jgi:hypothetical protein
LEEVGRVAKAENKAILPLFYHGGAPKDNNDLLEIMVVETQYFASRTQRPGFKMHIAVYQKARSSGSETQNIASLQIAKQISCLPPN